MINITIRLFKDADIEIPLVSATTLNWIKKHRVFLTLSRIISPEHITKLRYSSSIIAQRIERNPQSLSRWTDHMWHNTLHHSRSNKNMFGYQAQNMKALVPRLSLMAYTHIRERMCWVDTGLRWFLLLMQCYWQQSSCVCWKYTLPHTERHHCPCSYTRNHQNWDRNNESHLRLEYLDS